MKNSIRHIIGICIAALTLVCMALTYGMGVVRENGMLCRGVNVIITDSLHNRFVSGKEISDRITAEYGECRGRRLDSLNLTAIEKIADAQSAVRRSDAYTTADGLLNIRIDQRKPIVRFQKGDVGFYADGEAYLFPLQPTFTASVPIIDGELPINVSAGFKGRLEDTEWVEKMIGFIRMIDADRQWRGCITQIHINGKTDIEVVTRRGNEIFLLGQPVNLEDKLSRMETYYRMVLPQRERPYKTVDLRFDGKIIGKD